MCQIWIKTLAKVIRHDNGGKTKMVPCIDDELAFGEVFCKSQFLNIDEQSWTLLIEVGVK